MSVRIPVVDVSPLPMPQFSARSRREAPTRDTANARNIELWQGGGTYQPIYRPDRQLTMYQSKEEQNYYDQQGVPSRNKPPQYLPAPQFEPGGPKLEGNAYFDQYSPRFDPRNAARELSAVIKEPKADRGVQESQRILARGFSARYVPEGFAEQNQLDSLQAFELLRPKIDDGTKAYRQY